MAAMGQEEFAAGSDQRPDRTPVGGRARTCRVASREQHGQLMGSQLLSAAFGGRGPPGETPLGKPLVAEPEPLAVVQEHLQRCPLAIAEDERGTGERIVLKGFLAEPR